MKSDGSTASYYQLPEDATELQHLISHKDMNSQIGEIFRSAYRYGESSHSDKLRDAKKIKFYIEAEIERLEKLIVPTLIQWEFVMGEKVVYMGDVVTILDCNVDSDQYYIRAMTGAKVWVKAKRISKMQVV